MMKRIIAISLAVSSGLASCTKERGEVPSLGCTNMSYAADIQPITAAKCATAGCHVSGGAGPGDFTQYGDFKAKVDAGMVNNRLFVTKDMPPGGSPQLSQEELNKIKCWMEQGAQNN